VLHTSTGMQQQCLQACGGGCCLLSYMLLAGLCKGPLIGANFGLLRSKARAAAEAVLCVVES
jgi:hypothetical protein